MNKKSVLVLCEFYVSFISIGLLVLMIYLFIFPMFINPNPLGSVTINTNNHNELFFEWNLIIISFIVAIVCVIYITYYRFRRLG